MTAMTTTQAPVSLTDAMKLVKDANKLITVAASDTWNRMRNVIDEILRPGNRNYVLTAFQSQRSMTTINNQPAIYMHIGTLSKVTEDQIGRIIVAAGSTTTWSMSVPPGANTLTLELWINVITPGSTVSISHAISPDSRHALQRALEDKYTPSYLLGWLITMFVLFSLSYFVFDAEPATRAIVFG